MPIYRMRINGYKIELAPWAGGWAMFLENRLLGVSSSQMYLMTRALAVIQ